METYIPKILNSAQLQRQRRTGFIMGSPDQHHWAVLPDLLTIMLAEAFLQEGNSDSRACIT